MMNNERGSTLVLTLGIVIFFILMGLASINFAMLHNELTEKERSSAAAFWLAEAGVEKALSKLPTLIPETDPAVTVGDGTYDVTSAPDPACPHCTNRWVVSSQGVVNNQTRHIKAVVAKGAGYVEDVLDAKDHVKNYENCPPASVDISCEDPADCPPTSERCALWNALAQEYDTDLSFDTVFHGALTKQDIITSATGLSSTYENPENGFEIKDATYVKLTGTNPPTLDLSKANQTAASSFLLIDASLVPAGVTTKVKLAGNMSFNGIIWIVGNTQFSMTGTSLIKGAVFVEGTFEVKTGGTAMLQYDPSFIESVVTDVGQPEASVPALVAWGEF